MGSSLGFGSAPCYYIRPIQTRFRYGSVLSRLNLATQEQLVGSLCKRHVVARTYTSLPPLINIWFQFLFHSPSGVLFTFPSRYLFTIGHQVVFSLTPWSGQILTEFHVLRDTWENNCHSHHHFIYETFTLFGHPFQSVRL